MTSFEYLSRFIEKISHTSIQFPKYKLSITNPLGGNSIGLRGGCKYRALMMGLVPS
jgi:hypothetical protein